MKIIKSKLYATIAGVGLILAIAFFQFHVSFNNLVAKASGFSYYGSGTSSSIVCTSGSLLLATSTPSRVYMRVTDTSAALGAKNDIYLGLGTSVATGTGIYLNASSSSWEMGQNELVYAGPIYCNAPDGNATATIVTIP